jgi:hypothetical protein
MNGAHVALDLVYHNTQQGDFISSAGLLCFFPELLVALHATNLAIDSFPVGRLDDVLVAIYAIPAAVHTLLKLFRRYVQIAILSICCRPGKILSAVAAKTPFITQFGVRWFGKHCSAEWKLQSGNKEHGNENPDR